jgi:hypothetical protein
MSVSLDYPVRAAGLGRDRESCVTGG